MALKDELEARVGSLARSRWEEIPVARVIPTPESLTFDNTGSYVDGCVLYADIHRSTAMVQSLTDTRAAETYKAFLYCAARILRSNGGNIVAYDGDRVMAIFMGDGRVDRAITSAFQLFWAVVNVINPAFASVYRWNPYTLQHTVGIDAGRLLASKTGVRLDSDLVWVGNAANHASKLNSFPDLNAAFPTRITKAVWNEASYWSCFSSGSPAVPYWGPDEEIDGIVYRASSYWRPVT